MSVRPNRCTTRGDMTERKTHFLSNSKNAFRDNNMVSSLYSESPTLTGANTSEKCYIVPRNSIVDARNRPDFARIVSALEI